MTHPFECKIEIRFSDMDAYGHVNNAVYFTYLETARVKIFNENFMDFMHAGIFFVVAHASCDYKKAIKLEDREVTVRFSVHSKGRTSFEVNYELLGPAGQLFAKAKTVMVALDPKKGTPMIIPEDMMAKLHPT